MVVDGKTGEETIMAAYGTWTGLASGLQKGLALGMAMRQMRMQEEQQAFLQKQQEIENVRLEQERKTREALKVYEAEFRLAEMFYSGGNSEEAKKHVNIALEKIGSSPIDSLPDNGGKMISSAMKRLSTMRAQGFPPEEMLYTAQQYHAGFIEQFGVVKGTEFAKQLESYVAPTPEQELERKKKEFLELSGAERENRIKLFDVIEQEANIKGDIETQNAIKVLKARTQISEKNTTVDLMETLIFGSGKMTPEQAQKAYRMTHLGKESTSKADLLNKIILEYQINPMAATTIDQKGGLAFALQNADEEYTRMIAPLLLEPGQDKIEPTIIIAANMPEMKKRLEELRTTMSDLQIEESLKAVPKVFVDDTGKQIPITIDFIDKWGVKPEEKTGLRVFGKESPTAKVVEKGLKWWGETIEKGQKVGQKAMKEVGEEPKEPPIRMLGKKQTANKQLTEYLRAQGWSNKDMEEKFNLIPYEKGNK